LSSSKTSIDGHIPADSGGTLMAAPIIDWVVAEWLATRIAGSGSGSATDVGAGIDLNALAVDAERRVVAYTGLTPTQPLPPPEAVSRSEWAASNISSSRAMMDPLLGRVSAQLKGTKGLSLMASAAASTEVGLLFGYMSSRVLGQYELILLDEYADGQQPRLLMVMPNLGKAIERFDADPLEFITWVTLHETTHAVQFGSVSWLRVHLAGLLREMIDHAEQRLGSSGRGLRIPSRDELARIGRAARSGDLIGMVAGDAERKVIDQAQAVMAVVEGHAEHVMDAVAPELIPSLPDLRKKMSGRRKQQSLPGKVLNRVLGMEMKMRQYEHGKTFCDAVVAGGGTDALLFLFSSPAALPSLSEIQTPQTWLDRVKREL
jgi:coenzyme F420 biosynthesis associated uncharacterized protein